MNKKKIIPAIFCIIIIILFIILIFNIQNIEVFDNSEDETTCNYVSTLGIRKACEKINKCIYLNHVELIKFKIPNHSFILVTGDNDRTFPDNYIEKSKEILNSPFLIHWYSQNLNDLTKNKLSSIPIGLDYHTLAKKGTYWGGQISSKKQELILNNIDRKPFYERIIKVYVNFAKSANYKDRKDALEQTSKDLQIIEKDLISREETWKNMVKYAFVLSPHGNGLDCHRTWEALVLGCIPIVKTSSLNILYDDLPVLIVDNWSDINEQLLKNTIENFKNKDFNYNKLTLDYWIKKIKNN